MNQMILADFLIINNVNLFKDLSTNIIFHYIKHTYTCDNYIWLIQTKLMLTYFIQNI